MISISEAWDHIESNVVPQPIHNTNLLSATGHILANDVIADVDSPPHDKSIMDGYAVRAADLYAGQLELDVIETIVAGSCPQISLRPGTAARIMTGAPLPPGADAVVMVEQTEIVSDTDRVKFHVTDLKAGQHTMRRADNYHSGEVLFKKGHRVRPADIGLLAEVGQSEVSVYRQPRVAVLPTGNELVDVQQIPGPAQIRNSNGPMLTALNQANATEVRVLEVGRDEESALRAQVNIGLQHDILLLSGGVSAGMLDLVPKVLTDCGVQKIFHKIAVKPGKPIWFGRRVQDSHTCYVFGLPGNPVSSLVGYHLFVRHAIDCMFEQIPRQRWRCARLANDHHTRGNRPTFWPGRIVVDSKSTRYVIPEQWNGSSDLRTLGSSDCLIHFPVEKHDYHAEEEVEIWPLDHGHL